jgi:type III pantothenate kinase
MNLVIDIGNSNIKIGSFEDGELLSPVKTVLLSELAGEVSRIDPDMIIVSSVAGRKVENHPAFSENQRILFLNYKTPLPFVLQYDTPETLGVDRIAAAAGAQAINPGGSTMIIDAGTCITYDMIDGSGIFHGGTISPGAELRFKAMHNYTGSLPLLEFDPTVGEEPLIGKSTISAMKSGVINGIKGEMESFIEGYRKLYPDLKVIICGGQAKFFESRLKASIFAVPELVLTGLNRILEYNE